MKMMKTSTTAMAAMIIFIFMFCHHILLRSCRPVLWKRSACMQALAPLQHQPIYPAMTTGRRCSAATPVEALRKNLTTPSTSTGQTHMAALLTALILSSQYSLYMIIIDHRCCGEGCNS